MCVQQPFQIGSFQFKTTLPNYTHIHVYTRSRNWEKGEEKGSERTKKGIKWQINFLKSSPICLTIGVK